MSILGAKIQTCLYVIYVCWTYQVILDNYQKDLISEAMVLWLLFCGLTCNEKWICYKKLFFLTSQPFVKNYFFAATNSVRKLLGNAFQFGSSNKATANKLQFFLSCYSNKAGKYFLVNHVPICWALKSLLHAIHFLKAIDASCTCWLDKLEQILSFLEALHR